MEYYIEHICKDCKGKGCPVCHDTGAIEVQVTAEEFYHTEKFLSKTQIP